MVYALRENFRINLTAVKIWVIMLMTLLFWYGVVMGASKLYEAIFF